MKIKLITYRKTGILISSMLMLSLLCSCVTAPYTNRDQFILTSVDEENALGLQAWQEVKTGSKPSGNSEYIEAVNRVGHNIAGAVGDSSYSWEFLVIESDEVNAFCLPGGKIAVYTGLLKYTANDAELASIMGHEVGHAIARHSGERMTQVYTKQLGGSLLGAALESADVSQEWVQVYAIAADLSALLPYSRLHEYEADQIGILLMAKAGYNPEAALSFWDKFSKLSNYGSVQEFFVTHPMGSKRLEELRSFLPQALELYTASPVKLGYGERIR